MILIALSAAIALSVYAYLALQGALNPGEQISIIDLSGEAAVTLDSGYIAKDREELENLTTEVGFFWIENEADREVTITGILLLPPAEGIDFSTYEAKIPPGGRYMPVIITRYRDFGEYSFNRIRLCYALGGREGCVEAPARITFRVTRAVGAEGGATSSSSSTSPAPA